MSNANIQAFPREGFVDLRGEWNHEHDGLTKREYFAGLAMQGLLANPYYAAEAHMTSGTVESAALFHADALLAALEPPHAD
jgi:hypothetical protein